MPNTTTNKLVDMGSNSKEILVSVFLCLSCLMLVVQSKQNNASTDCKVTEREALTKFKKMLFDPSNLLSSWTGENCCRWNGISCNGETGHVTKINLTKTCKPDGGSCIGGQISSSLLDLKYLNYLDLSLNDFRTPIPEFFGSLEMLIGLNLYGANFRGMVPPHLGNLSNLRYLDLSSNYLWVSDMFWISSLTSLEQLDMGHLNLSLAASHWLQALNFLPSLAVMIFPGSQLQNLPQSLPSALNFTHLYFIRLSDNGFNSLIPRWFSNLSSLVSLDLSLNEIKGDINELVGDLAKCCTNSLERLVLTQNKISGQLTNSLGLLKNLRVLSLSVNSISGPIPTSIGNLTNLESIDVSNNRMNGSIPESMKKLANLEWLLLLENNWQGVLSQNQLQGLKKLVSFSLSSMDRNFILIDDWLPLFSLESIQIKSCNLGPNFPTWVKAQEKLAIIILTDVGISDFLPDWFSSFSSELRWCDFSDNKIKGILPSSLTPLQNLYFLNLAGNLLSGSIPSNIGQTLSSVAYLNLSGNSLSGPIPYSIGEMKNLFSLDLSKNKLSGEIDQEYWRNLENLIILDLSMNILSGSICRSTLLLQKLTYLILSNNNLSGDLFLFPVNNASDLSLLDLGGNEFSGKIPKWIGEMRWLSELQLRDNMFSGNIPEELCSLEFLHILDISFNNLSGRIPACLDNLTAFYTIYKYTPSLTSMSLELSSSPKFTYNYISQLKVVLKGRETVYTNVLMLVNILDFSNNNFIGEIPKELTRLSRLGALNLSRNHLTGHVPEDIGALRLLESLDLSWNHLSGPIPPSMTSMTLLSHVNLSNNNLSGPIPSTNQFLTFNDPSIYNGNPGLCGSPLQTECRAQTPGDEKDNNRLTDNDEKFGFFVSIGFGFIFGFWGVFGSLAIYRPWRITFFRHVDNLINSLDIGLASVFARFQIRKEDLR